MLEYITCELRLGERVLAAVADLPLADEAIVVANARLEEAVGCGSVCPVDLDAVLGLLLDADLGEVCHDIGREVGVGVLDLVEGLLLDRRDADEATRAGQLCDHAVALLIDLDDGEAEVPQVGHFLVAGIGEVPAADLTGAFEQVTDHVPRPRRV